MDSEDDEPFDPTSVPIGIMDMSEEDETFQLVNADITPDADGNPATFMLVSVDRAPDPQSRDGQTLRRVEETYMQVVAAITGAQATHTGQGTTAGNGNHWDFELTYPGGGRGLGEHVLYTNPSTNDAPEHAAFRPSHAVKWDPDGDFRAILASPAVTKHVRRVSAWHRNAFIALDESHLVIETHSVVPAVELIDVWAHQRGQALQPLRSALTHDEVGDVTYIWVMTSRSPNILLLANGTWVPLTLGDGEWTPA